MYNFFKSIFWNELGSIRFYSFCNSPLSQTEPCDSKWQAQFYCCLKSILIAEAGIILRTLHNSTLLRTKHSIRSSMPGSLSLSISALKRWASWAGDLAPPLPGKHKVSSISFLFYTPFSSSILDVHKPKFCLAGLWETLHSSSQFSFWCLGPWCRIPAAELCQLRTPTPHRLPSLCSADYRLFVLTVCWTF